MIYLMGVIAGSLCACGMTTRLNALLRRILGGRRGMVSRNGGDVYCALCKLYGTAEHTALCMHIGAQGGTAAGQAQ